MAASSRRAVITGIGLITPLGFDPETVWNAIVAGRSGVRRIRSFDTSGLPVHIGGEIDNYDAREFVSQPQRKNLRVMARPIQMAVSAAQRALDDSRIDKAKLDKTRFGAVFGTGLIATDLIDLADASKISVTNPPAPIDMDLWGSEGLRAIQPLWMLKYLPNMLACQVSILQDAQGHNNSITMADVASTLALGEAYRVLLRDRADFFLVGGGESKLNPLSLTRQCLYEHISRSSEVPEKACRPFDKNRDGLVVGEGSGVFVVEDLDHAQKRGARIYAEVVGFGAAFDHRQNGAGVMRAVRAAMKEAKVRPEDIDHINGHGMATIKSDVCEARGLHEIFGHTSTPVPVFAGKSYLGNMGAAAGTVELALSLLGLKHGQMPPTLNYETPDPECPIAVLAGKHRPVTRPYVLKVSFNQLGQCAAAVLRKW
jgi:3-oxoacyl-[acyl-carrier-protein] synthase II